MKGSLHTPARSSKGPCGCAGAMWEYFIASLIVLLSFLSRATTVQISHLKVPAHVHNGSHSAILDCDYHLGPRENRNDSGLVVKWFFNSSPYPVYQWIPPQKPQELGLLRGRLDLSYEPTTNNVSRHRALCIRNPTTELSGEWKCEVSTFNNEDFMTKKMVVYAKEKRFELTQSRPPQEQESVNITCRAQGLYPEPKMYLYKDDDNTLSKGRRSELPGVDVKIVARSGVYDIVATKLLYSEELSGPTVLACELRVPAANYSKLKSLVAYPGSLDFPYSDDAPRITARVFIACLAISLPLLRFLT